MAPKSITRKAIAELEAGKGKRFASVDALMADLHTDDCTSSEFAERGIASIAATKRDGGSVPAEAVIARLEAKLAAARQAKAQRGASK